MAEAVDLRVADEQDQALPPISTTYEPACGAAPRTFQPACEEDHRSQNRVGSEEESVEKRPRGGPEVRATDVQGIISVLEAISRRLPALLQSVKKGQRRGVAILVRELTGLLARFDEEHLRDSYLLRLCQSACQAGPRDRLDLVYHLMGDLGDQISAILAAAENLLEKLPHDDSTQTNPRPPRAKRGRPRSKTKSERDRVIRQEFRNHSGMSYPALAEMLGEKYPRFQFSADIVRNAIHPRR